MPRPQQSEKLQRYCRDGWAPVSYRHLHPDLKKLIREIRFQPGIRACFQNCQHILLNACGTTLAPRLEYHEGWATLSVGVPIEHAWLTLDGVVQDPTLEPQVISEYRASHVYTADQVREATERTGRWAPVDSRALLALLFGPEIYNMNIIV